MDILAFSIRSAKEKKSSHKKNSQTLRQFQKRNTASAASYRRARQPSRKGTERPAAPEDVNLRKQAGALPAVLPERHSVCYDLEAVTSACGRRYLYKHTTDSRLSFRYLLAS